MNELYRIEHRNLRGGISDMTTMAASHENAYVKCKNKFKANEGPVLSTQLFNAYQAEEAEKNNGSA
jgi:hypothetical protein